MQTRLTAVRTVEELETVPYQMSDIDNQYIVSFELIEKNKLFQYIENSYLYSRVQHSRDLTTERRGLSIPLEQAASFPPDHILWQKNSNRYTVFLMKEEISSGFPNNLQQKLKEVQKTYRTGSIISRFLLCGHENGKTYDFYKTFVEILP